MPCLLFIIFTKMKITTITSVLALAAAISVNANAQSRMSEAFTENFDNPSSEFFNIDTRNLRHFCGVPSLSEVGTDVLLMRIDPKTPAGAGRGPEISSRKNTHFGSYSARLRVPDVKAVQPNVGSVVGYFTYREDRNFGLSEIDIEFLIADPRIIYVGTWTSTPGNVGQLQRVGRTINLATGKIYETIYRSYHDGNRNHPFTDSLSTIPTVIEPIEGFDASKQFYTYGFDWHADRLTWWILHPQTGEKIILWDYQGTTPNFSGIPQPPSTYLLNFWHTNDWSVETNPRSLEAPAYPYMLEADWMSFEPFEDESNAWIEKNNWK